MNSDSSQGNAQQYIKKYLKFKLASIPVPQFLKLLSGSITVASTQQLSVLWQVFTMHSVTKATPIQFVDGKCYHIKKQKSYKTALYDYAWFSHDLLLIPLGVETYKHTKRKRTNILIQAHGATKYVVKYVAALQYLFIILTNIFYFAYHNIPFVYSQLL